MARVSKQLVARVSNQSIYSHGSSKSISPQCIYCVEINKSAQLKLILSEVAFHANCYSARSFNKLLYFGEGPRVRVPRVRVPRVRVPRVRVPQGEGS